MPIVETVHSTLRWVIVLVAVVAAVKFALGWWRGGRYGGMDRGLSSGFSGLMDLQALLGVALLVLKGITPLRLEHAGTMIVAVVVAHLPMRWKNAPDAVRYRNGLFAVLGALLLVSLGIALLPESSG